MPNDKAADLLAKIQDKLAGQQECLEDVGSTLKWTVELLEQLVGESSHVVKQLMKAYKLNEIAQTLGQDIGFDVKQLATAKAAPKKK